MDELEDWTSRVNTWMNRVDKMLRSYGYTSNEPDDEDEDEDEESDE
jgi:hypothetical protein